MTGGSDRGLEPGRPADAPSALVEQRRDHAAGVLAQTLENRDATAYVHVGTERDPAIRYSCSPPANGLVAVAYDGTDGEWLIRTADGSDGHPAADLAAVFADRGREGTILTPARIPHDAALYLENAGFEVASTDAIERARATKTAAEHERIAAVQRAASAGIRHAASLLADATVVDGRLAVTEGADDPVPLTPARVRTAIDEAIVGAGAFPAGNTAINPSTGPTAVDGEALSPDEPIVLAVAPRGPAGYYGGLVRTLIVDSDGGRERRVHVAVTQSFRSARSLLTASSASVHTVAADLEAEVRSFGLDAGVEATVAGVGLESRERPTNGDEIEPGAVIRLDVAARVDETSRLRIADVLVVTDEGERPDRLAAPEHSLSPAALLEP
ncbi:M24 family metallopeptidase [Haloterrigena sp. H1]|uniref:M24 family metallopeptidase n=1 Tax=Haloterrigena sp. H1 TaxID=2552943 RepID=UPI00110E808C|nr:M24 family metallopeptidase [Haloterrigena sp. H1]TMT87753.1 M24 family metallopeptidase [Haloterrigena sp. H1]